MKFTVGWYVNTAFYIASFHLFIIVSVYIHTYIHIYFKHHHHVCMHVCMYVCMYVCIVGVHRIRTLEKCISFKNLRLLNFFTGIWYLESLKPNKLSTLYIDWNKMCLTTKCNQIYWNTTVTKNKTAYIFTHTHTHTHTNIYIYNIYIYIYI